MPVDRNVTIGTKVDAPAADADFSTTAASQIAILKRVGIWVRAIKTAWPATLGQKAKAASLPVTLASDEDLYVAFGTKTDAAAADADFDVTSASAISIWKRIGNWIRALKLVSGATTGAAVVTDADGTLQQYLRGLVKLVAAKIGITIADGDSATLGAKADAAAADADFGAGAVTLVTIEKTGFNWIRAIKGGIGTGDDAAIVTDANGTVRQYLRGLIKIFADIWTDAKNAIKVWQDTHDDLCANANIQVGNADASTTNPVPTKDAPYTTIKSGEIQGSAAAQQLPNIACSMVQFKACISNIGNVYIGAAGVTKPDGTTDATTGREMLPGDESPWLPTDNLNRFYLICDNATDDLTYWALA